jgi:SAM-dependent methyltransferase
MRGQAADHYRRIAGDFDDMWAYSPEFVDAVCDAMAEAARFRTTDVVADIGGGTGLYSRGLYRRAGLARPVFCVDPSEHMLANVPAGPGVVPVQASADEVAGGANVGLPPRFDVIVLKGVVQHLEDRGTVLGGLADRLNPGGRLLVAMQPRRIEQPLFTAALDRFEREQLSTEQIEVELRELGLHTTSSLFSYAVTLRKERILQMVRQRFLSLLTAFTDDEIEAGIAEIDARHPGDEIRYMERLILICGAEA